MFEEVEVCLVWRRSVCVALLLLLLANALRLVRQCGTGSAVGWMGELLLAVCSEQGCLLQLRCR